ncbi:MAG: OprD family outer membrane porin [Sulfurospirillaceae bacterium]|nr:OprD family outer membrane porin [Sulfurospirillaceae bacterium]
MKLAKLSLAAIVVAGLASSSFAADNLADAFKNGKVNGELRAWYWDRDTTVADADIFNTGLILGYVTDSFYGFTLGATFQSNYAPAADTDAKAMFAGDEYGSGAVLSEAYVAYNMKNTTVKVGRQFINTPLVSGSGSRMIKQSFEGALVLNTDLPQTTLAAGYVSKYQARTNGLGDAPEFSKTADFQGPGALYFDGAYTALVINKSIANLALVGQYAMVNDVAHAADVDVYHVEANYVLPMSGFKLGFDAAYRASKTEGALSGAGIEGNYLAGRIGVSELAGFGLSLAYGQSDSSDDLVAGMGGGADNLYTNTIIRGGGEAYQANTDAYLFNATYDFSKIGAAGLKAIGQYAVYNQDNLSVASFKRAVNKEIDYTKYVGALSYDFSGALKGLSVTAVYEAQEKETKTVSTGAKASVDTDEVRFMANYKF